MITLNDYEVLKAIMDKHDKNKGILKTKGTTKREIIDKTKLSYSKVSQSLNKFIDDGLIEQGLSIRTSKTYCVTSKGLEEILNLGGINHD